jgi:Protein of unknown function (DUF3015)
MRTVVQIQLALLVVAIPVGSVLAANPDNGPGCALGKLAWSDYKHPKNIAPQVMMATTNGTFGSQRFGISFGTSGCTNDGQVMAARKTDMFVALTFESLSEDLAQGSGEHLASLATMMGVAVEHQPTFFSLAQDRYRILIERGEGSPLTVIKAIQEAAAGHPLLAGIAERR